jgi:hypothetical protein
LIISGSVSSRVGSSCGRSRTGPRGLRVGRHLRYDPHDVRAWVESLMEGAAA